MSRLHFITPWQGRKPSVLSEELLLAQKREEKTYVFVPPFFGFSKMLLGDCLHFIQAIPHFWQKKWRRERETPLFLSKQPENKQDNLFLIPSVLCFTLCTSFLF